MRPEPEIVPIPTIGRNFESVLSDSVTGAQLGWMNYEIDCPGAAGCGMCKGLATAAMKIPVVGVLAGILIGQLACRGC